LKAIGTSMPVKSTSTARALLPATRMSSASGLSSGVGRGPRVNSRLPPPGSSTEQGPALRLHVGSSGRTRVFGGAKTISLSSTVMAIAPSSAPITAQGRQVRSVSPEA